MNSNSFLRRAGTLGLTALAWLLLSATAGTAQTGTISGRVLDGETGRALQGAVVSVAGTDLVAYTDIEGRYTLTGVPAGAREVAVYYVGLDEARQSVQVGSGTTAAANVDLTSQVQELETMTVRENLLGQALAINQQKTADGIINVVSEEIFGVMRDGNVGQALQRLPGVSVDEDQDGAPASINIRGIAGEFNSFQIDGNRAPTSGGSRSFNPRQFGADGIAAIEVIKAPTPDRDGDAIGGIINVVTRTAFQLEGRELVLNAGAVLNDISDEWGYVGNLKYSDLFSVGGGEKNLGLSVTLSSYDTDRYSINADQDWVLVTPANNPTLNLDQYDVPVWFMEATHWEYDTRQTNTNTVSASIDFRTDDQNSFYFRPMYSVFTVEGTKFETDVNIDTRFQDAVGGRKTYAALTPSMGRGTPGNSGSRGTIGWIGTDEDRENQIYGLSVGGRHERGESLLTYDLYYSASEFENISDTELNMVMEPDSPWFLYEYNIIDPFGNIELTELSGNDPTDLSMMSEGELIEETSLKEETVLSARVDWQRVFDLETGSFTLKTGAKYRSSSPEYDLTANVFEMDDSFPYAQVVEPTDEVLLLKPKYWDVYPRRGQELRRTNPGLFEVVEDDTLEDSNVSDYDASEDTAAAYVMGTYRRGIHSIIVGLRYEQFDWEATNKIVSYLNDVPSVRTVTNGESYDFWLPGVHLRHELKENIILRESYNRSYGRPRLSELSRGRWVDDDGNIEDGNPLLEPAVADNFDVQLEYYTDRGGLYSVGFFYKDIEDFSYVQVYDFDVLGADGIPIPVDGGNLEYERPVNGSSATNYGVELIARQRAFFLPDPFDGLALSLSATFTESEADYPNRTDGRDLPLPGFSDTLFTGSLEYVWRNLFARLDYRYRSDYIEGLGDDIETDEFYAAEERVDAEIRYQFTPRLMVYVNGTNLTDRPQLSYTGYAQFVEDASYAGRKYSFGAEYRF